ncbi:hypothetical protein Q7P37_010421 [Cladosporium fusiforme]
MSSSNWPQFDNSADGQSSRSFHTSSSSQSYNTGNGSSSFEGFPSFGSQPSYSSYTSSSYSMSDSKTFYISSVSNGHVLAHKADGRPSGVVAENKGDRGQEQNWTIEYGDEPNTIALKNAASGTYLHCQEPKSFGKVGTGDKQWWKISDDDVSPPGACRLCPVNNPDVFLNHHSGNHVRRGATGAKVHMYKWEPHNERHTAWYFADTNGSFNPAASTSSSGGASVADFDAKLKALEEREAALTKKDSDRSAGWDQKMKEVQDRQESIAQEEKDRAASYEKKLKDLQAREAELSKKQEQQAKSSKDVAGNQKDSNKDDQTKKEADLQRKLDDLKTTEQKVAADRAAVDKAKSDLVAKEKELQQRQKKISDQQSSVKQDAKLKEPTQAAPNGTADSELAKKQRDNAKLEQRLSRLEDQLAQMSGSAGEKPQPNGSTKSSTPSNAGSIGCGQKHYKPPRKLNRRVIGLVYE